MPAVAENEQNALFTLPHGPIDGGCVI